MNCNYPTECSATGHTFHEIIKAGHKGDQGDNKLTLLQRKMTEHELALDAEDRHLNWWNRRNYGAALKEDCTKPYYWE